MDGLTIPEDEVLIVPSVVESPLVDPGDPVGEKLAEENINIRANGVKNSLTKVRNAQLFITRIRNQMQDVRKTTTLDKRRRMLAQQTRKHESMQVISLSQDISSPKFTKRLSMGANNPELYNLLKPRMSRIGLRLPDVGSAGGAYPSPDSVFNGRQRARRRRPDLGRKFKAAAWISIIIRRLCIANLRNTEDSDSPYMKNIKFVDSMVNENKGNLMFSVEEFKANREMRMSEVSKLILIKPRWARTDQELLHVEIVLRNIKDYADYPVAIQRKIAEVGEYLKYESRRIIVREGHPAWNFYFILSGSVVVLVMDEERSFVKPKAILRKGQSFGELALIHGDRRRSTIVAMEETEMLSIWYEDYEAIFMDGGVSKAEDEFIRELNFLQGWPIEIADEHPDLFRYHFYKRSEIVVRDSNCSTWVIVVKSGSLKVMKRLRKVEAFEWRKQHSAGSRKAINVELENAIDTMAQENAEKSGAGDDDHQLCGGRQSARGGSGCARVLGKNSLKKGLQKAMPNSVQVSLRNVKEIGGLDASSFKQEILTAADDFDVGYQQADFGNEELLEPNPMFVHIQTLTKGQVFGLYEIVLGKQPSFCVVSNGAEVIMIDKTFYREHLNDGVLKRIRDEAQAYPSDTELQDNLQLTVDWVAYKAATLRSAVNRNPRISRNVT